MKISFSLIMVLLYLHAVAQLHVSAFFGDHMVLQRDKPVTIWGVAKPGDAVTVTLEKIKGSAIADKQGKWKISLSSFSAGGPVELMIQTKNETKTFSDVLIGEVWLCSGQSNMQFKVSQAINAKQEISQANNPMIRQVRIPNKLSLQPEEFIDSTEWIISSPQTTGEFTAVGYFFARDIYDRLKVPIGLLYDNWGGSQVESWISRDAMMGSEELKNYAQQIPANWAESEARMNQVEREATAKQNGGKLPVMTEEEVLKENDGYPGWFSSSPGSWDWKSLPAFRGLGYMAKELNLDSTQAAMGSLLSLGTNDSKYRLFINGKFIQEGQSAEIIIQLPPLTWKAGKNILLIEQGAAIKQPWNGMGLHGESAQLFINFGGDKISLADNHWKMLARFDQPHSFSRFMNNEGTTIYNAMIHPLTSLKIKGVLWYQGEANTGRAFEYRKTFPLLINSWRKEWADEFPFIFVQLSSFGSNESANAGSGWAELREAQSNTLRLSKTGMAVTTDIGDPNDIHPKNKQEVGRRLAALALNDIYGISQTANGPVYDSVSFSNHQARLFFTSVGKGLVSKDPYGYLRGFEVAGTDKKFYYAQAEIQGNQVVVRSDSVSDPVAIRYGWSDAPADINLYNLDGFPASPFRTDHWKGVNESAGFFVNSLLLLF